MRLSAPSETRRATRGRRLLGLTALACGLVVALAAPAFAAPSYPGPKPTGPGPAPVDPGATAPVADPTRQIQATSAAKAQLASEIGRLNGEIAAKQVAVQQAQAALNLAEQKVALAVSKQQEAMAAATKAKAAVGTEQKKVDAAHERFVQFVQASYMSTDIGGTAGTLLTAPNPDELLDRAGIDRYIADDHVDAVDVMQTATVAKSNADAKARAAEQKAQDATKAAQAAQQTAHDDFTAQQVAERNLESAQAADQVSLQQKQQMLAQLSGQKAVYDLYQSQKARSNSWKSANATYQDELSHWKTATANYEAWVKAHPPKKHQSGGGSGGGGSSSGGGGGSYSPGPSGGSWTAAKGRAAANRALTTRGTIYIWAGGNRYGPTDGGCTDPVSPCGTQGYDCSGLVLYGWKADWAHYAATQYTQAGSYHPSSDDFMPGDLLFWSENGTVGGIGHVAIYIGHGDVVQAPQSGDVVKITPWDQVEYGYFGATRPRT